ncbi:MAG: filamentous hemagglutinin N-terminal domain-containing protein [Scytonema hyalinum WJT4-NPBG1]|nr:filamentous hemagglutinin N-terminal domain-containing protein [Scytonema hyalinum WJT4-NPBG1]
MRKYILRLWIISGISIYSLTTIGSTQAQETQIVPDGTLPTNSVVTPQSNIQTITEGTVAGSNLFHSFGQFNIKAGDKADFVSPSSNIENILVRVTGGSRSEIMGTLATSGLSNPNLFLINPSGIVFGPNASLNVSGSFVATTANALQFGNQGFFNASVPNNPALLTVKPSAFLLNQIAAKGSITNESRTGLEVLTGKSLLLVGGNVSLDGGILQTSGGRVELAGLAGQGTVELNFDSDNLSLNFPEDVALADVSLTKAEISALDGGSIAITAKNLGLQGSSLTAGIQSVGIQGGDIMLNAKEKMTIANSQISNDLGGSFFSQPVGNTGGILIKAGSLSLNRATLNADTNGKGNTTGIFVQANSSVDILDESLLSSSVNSTAAVGNTGGIHIKAGSVNLINGSTLNANSFGQGETTGVFVQANGSVLVNNSTISTEAGETGTGNGGNINIQAGKISLTDNAVLNSITYREGLAGDVIIDAGNSISVDKSRISSQTFGPGNAGIINIKTGELSLTKGGVVLSSTSGRGMAGNIQINASDIIISGVDPEGFSSGLFTSSEKQGSGLGGEISVTTARLRVSDGGVVSARTRSASNGGNITVNTNTLELSSGGQLLTSAFSSGNAGNITVNATNRVSISGSDPTFAARLKQFGEATVDNDGPNSGLFARVRGNATANAGNIEVNARSIRLDNQATITTGTTSGEGGDITLKARDIVLRNNSNITATAGTDNAGGNGGNIKIDTDVLVSAKNSDITANAFEGKGGNIRINTQGLFLSPDSDITASSERGIAGVVEINTPDIDPTSGLVNLPEAPPHDTRVAQGCQPGGSQQKNQFIITGRGGLPPSPFEMLTPDAVQVDLVTLKPEGENRKNANVTSTTTATPEPIVEATGWVVNAKGEVVLIAYAPTFTPHSSWQTSPKCDAK